MARSEARMGRFQAVARERGVGGGLPAGMGQAAEGSYWKRTLGMAGGPVRRRARRRASAAGLVPVQLVSDVGLDASGSCLEIHLSSGERVVFPDSGSMDVLRAVVGLLRERC